MPLLNDRYQYITQLAYSVLLQNDVCKLPVDVLGLTQSADIKVVNDRDVGELTETESGAGIFDGDQWYIIYAGGMNLERKRFTIAHELGHILLRHKTVRGRYAKESEAEAEADLFASRLLAPPCILWELRALSANNIRLTCGISHPAAAIQSRHMVNMVYDREKPRSGIESALIEQFRAHIRHNKIRAHPYEVPDKLRYMTASQLYDHINNKVYKKPQIDIC